MTEKIGQFSFQNGNLDMNVSLHEDSSGWPTVVAESGGQAVVFERGASHEEVLMLGLGAEAGLRAVKALRQSQQ